MLTYEEYKNVIANCVIRFKQYHPDCGFGLDTFAFSIVEPEKFIDTVMLSGKMESETPYAVTDCFLNDLGYAVIEVQLLHEDYSEAVGWE